MKVATILMGVLAGVVLLFVVIRLADDTVAPLFLNSRIERLGERNLPKISVEHEATIYCRMKADDFRFPLPTGTLATNLSVTGGFDTIDGSVEARFIGTNHITPSGYEIFLSGKVQVGGDISAQTIPGGLLIKFHYFGDR